MSQDDFRKYLELQRKLTDPDISLEFLREAFDVPPDEIENSGKYFMSSLFQVSKIYGIRKLANETGIGKCSMYNVLANRTSSRTFHNLIKILKVMGLRFSIEPIERTSNDISSTPLPGV